MNIKLISILSVIFLIMSIPSNLFPYGYYIFLRWFICIASFIIAYTYYNFKNQSWMIVFGIVSILFNPIAPIYLSKSVWVTLDLATAGLFLYTISNPKDKYNKK